VKLLLDTHAALSWPAGDERFGEEAAARLSDRAAEILLSAVVVWEISIKRGLGKLQAPDDILGRLRQPGLRVMPIAYEHAVAAGGLPWHHRDPFDRMLVAQARLEGLTVMTEDRRIRAYSVDTVAAT